jgi:hypothetical protein
MHERCKGLIRLDNLAKHINKTHPKCIPVEGKSLFDNDCHIFAAMIPKDRLRAEERYPRLNIGFSLGHLLFALVIRVSIYMGRRATPMLLRRSSSFICTGLVSILVY